MRTGAVCGPGPARLRVDGTDVAAATVADTPATRRKGLLGTDRLEGALWITRCPTVHMVGMRYPIDVAVVDREGTVLHTATLRPWWGMTMPRWRASATVEMPVGSLRDWGITRGRTLSLH
ncbi:DUF192 domain-containing protein [Serinicoccus kebangsaanensis]|uniref:DUF192 domain-containing protein n=1 Tax=Serinicoccus kebangsaanensis TaxID=2602069 RepID=UPI00124C4C80|nr:DUF192 domain-containing protein [Serinicoccus kebangsaanensis]